MCLLQPPSSVNSTTGVIFRELLPGHAGNVARTMVLAGLSRGWFGVEFEACSMGQCRV